MGTTNRAEELAKELSERLERLCEGLAISGDSPSKETILNYFNELNNYRQSEIDELTNANKQAFLRGYESINSEVEIIKEEHAKQLDELTKEVERLRKENESFTEVWEEMAGLFSKRYDDEECGIHFKQRMKFLINKLQS